MLKSNKYHEYLLWTVYDNNMIMIIFARMERAVDSSVLSPLHRG